MYHFQNIDTYWIKITDFSCPPVFNAHGNDHGWKFHRGKN